ncbi:MAG: tetratricopeptide repeat protein [Rhodospirillales bacterium]|nr:tetratricopeptide repeat protein [Rhodospirillales bacterium]
MKHRFSCVIVGLVLATAATFSAALAQTLPNTPANRARGVVGCTQTRSGIVCPGAPSGGGSYGYGGGTSAFNMGMSLGNAMWQAFEAMERQAHQQRMTMARDLNDQGVALYNSGDYQGALAAFRNGLQYSPNSSTLLGNIQETEKRLTEQRAEADRRTRAQLAQARERISAMLGGLADDVARNNAELTAAADLSFVAPAGTSFFGLGGGPGGAAPPSGEGLAFVGPGESLFSRGTKYSAPVDLREGASDQLAASRPAGSDTGGRPIESEGGLAFVGPGETLKATVDAPPKPAVRPPAAREKIADTKLAARTDTGETPMAKPAGGGPAQETVWGDVPSPRLGAAQESAWQKLKKGTYFGAGFGEESAQWYADRYAASDKWYDRARYGAGGLFSSLWTPDTYKETALTLGPDAVFAAGKLVASAKLLRAGAALTPQAKLAVGLEHVAPKAGGGIGAETSVLRTAGKNPDILFFHQAKEEGKFGQVSADKLVKIADADYARMFKRPRDSAQRALFKEFNYLERNMAKQVPGGPSTLERADKLQAVSKKYNISFDITGSLAETELGKATRANPYLREHLPGFRKDKWWWKEGDVDIRFDKENFDKFNKLKISEKIGLTREIRDAATGGKRVRVDIRGYTERYLESAEGLPRLCVGSKGCIYEPGWGTPGWRPNYGNEVLWSKTPPHAN